MKYTILLDSSNTSLTVGLASETSLIDSISYEAWQCQSEHMIPELNTLLDKYSVDKKGIESVVVACGPGSYTGVRIAITIAKVLATCLPLKVYAVSSLHCLKDNDKPSICLINARSGRSYFGVFKGREVIENDQILTNDLVKEYIQEHPDYSICGNTAYLGLEGINSNIAEQLLSLKEEKYLVENPLALKPVYMKD